VVSPPISRAAILWCHHRMVIRCGVTTEALNERGCHPHSFPGRGGSTCGNVVRQRRANALPRDRSTRDGPMQSILSDPLLLCTRCGSNPKYQPPGSKLRSWCLGCLNAGVKARQQAYRDAGLCTCGREPIDGMGSCPRCWVSAALMSTQRIRRHGKTVRLPGVEFKRTAAVVDRWTARLEGAVCPYTGEALSPGTAQLDHRIPHSRADEFPEVDVWGESNLEWVSRRANQMKGDMTPDEFRAMCRVIAG
jgi:5-methylcytosine-specific restriction endonuclease McrA